MSTYWLIDMKIWSSIIHFVECIQNRRGSLSNLSWFSLTWSQLSSMDTKISAQSHKHFQVTNLFNIWSPYEMINRFTLIPYGNKQWLTVNHHQILVYKLSTRSWLFYILFCSETFEYWTTEQINNVNLTARITVYSERGLKHWKHFRKNIVFSNSSCHDLFKNLDENKQV